MTKMFSASETNDRLTGSGSGVKELTDQLSEVSSRAAALHYRLWQVLEDRKVLEMNLSGEQASTRVLERVVEELRKEVDRLRASAEARSAERAE